MRPAAAAPLCPAGTGSPTAGGTCSSCAFGSWGALDATESCTQCAVPNVTGVTFGTVGAVALITTTTTSSTSTADCTRGVLVGGTGLTVQTNAAATVQACATACNALNAANGTCAFITYTLSTAVDPEAGTTGIVASSCKLHLVSSTTTITTSPTFRVAYKLSGGSTYSWWRHTAIDVASIGGRALSNSTNTVSACLADCSARTACAAVLFDLGASWAAASIVTCTTVTGQSATAISPLLQRTLVADLAATASNVTSPLPAAPAATCPVGSYGTTSCTNCTAPRTTLTNGTTTVDGCVCPAGTGSPTVGGTCSSCAIGSWGALDTTESCTQCSVSNVTGVTFGTVGAVALITTTTTSSTSTADCTRGVLVGGTGLTVQTNAASTVQACATACDALNTSNGTCAFITYTLSTAVDPEAGTTGIVGSSCKLHVVSGSTTALSTFRVAYKLSGGSTYSWWRHTAIDVASIGGRALSTSTNTVSACLADCSTQTACSAVLFDLGANWTAASIVTCTTVTGQSATTILPLLQRTLVENVAATSTADNPIPAPICPIGYYGTTNCTACPSGKTTVSTGSTTVASCVCNIGSYGTAGATGTCTACPAATTITTTTYSAASLVVTPVGATLSTDCSRGQLNTPPSLYVITDRKTNVINKVGECIDACGATPNCHFVTYTTNTANGQAIEVPGSTSVTTCLVTTLNSTLAASGYRVAYKRVTPVGGYSWWKHIASTAAASIGGVQLAWPGGIPATRTVSSCLTTCDSVFGCAAVLFNLGTEAGLSTSTAVVDCTLVAGVVGTTTRTATLYRDAQASITSAL
ncbi:hypothetical protein HT031_002761 [Scenedesmus sp. PABB004]|nr:hypothetical protein HT031_002761 [Scenedesmus sp. PABB004]